MKSNELITWIEGDAPYSRRFEDRYFSAHDGREETRTVFLAGNGLPDRWRSGGHFHIAELGFGTGLNFFETLALWQQEAPPDARLTFTSFERYPLRTREMARALGNWSDLYELARPLFAQWPGTYYPFGNAELNLIFGDARSEIPPGDVKADAWYLDGFSPSKNPQLWETELMQAVFDHTRPNGTFSTYTAAGFVRRNLQAAGFDVQRVQGFGGKRERLQGQRVR